MPSYTRYTLETITQEISNSLSDPSNLYWTVEEVQSALFEALHDWSATTSYWVSRSTLPIIPPSSINPPYYYYDLSFWLPALRPRTITIDSIVRQVQYALIEPVTGLSGTGMTQQFSISSVIQAVIRARNQFVIDAQLPLTYSQSSSTPSADGEIFLSPSTAFIHRAVWLSQINQSIKQAIPLQRSDIYSFDSIGRDWNLNPAQSPNPAQYYQFQATPITIQLNPVPLNPGILDLLTVETLALLAAPNVLSPDVPIVSNTTTLGIPDDFAHAVKYCAISDLLTMDAESSNPFLARYCDFRYRSIVESAKLQRSVYRVLVNNIPIPLTTLASLDSLNPNWQITSTLYPSSPTVCATAFDILAFSPSPSTQQTVTADVICSARIPVAQSDPVEIGPEYADTIIDYCQHQLSLKLGGREFAQTFPLYDSFESSAVSRNALLSNSNRFLSSLFSQSEWDRALNPDLNPSPALITPEVLVK